MSHRHIIFTDINIGIRIRARDGVDQERIALDCALGSILFLGGWLSPIDVYPLNAIPSPLWLIFKILLLFILFALVKAIVPRYRYDQLMRLGWKVFLPFSLFWVVLTAGFLYFFNLLPK